MKREKWKLVAGGNHLISSYGRLYSLVRHVRTCGSQRNFTTRLVGGHFVKCNIGRGYKRANIGGDIVHIHILVATAFVRKASEELTVNYKDLDKLNNNSSNLEWITNSENVKHAWESGAYSCHKAVVCLDTGEKYNSLTDASVAVGLASSSNLTSHLKGNQPTFGGMRWAYA